MNGRCQEWSVHGAVGSGPGQAGSHIQPVRFKAAMPQPAAPNHNYFLFYSLVHLFSLVNDLKHQFPQFVHIVH
jgi:hypothetical protein